MSTLTNNKIIWLEHNCIPTYKGSDAYGRVLQAGDQVTFKISIGKWANGKVHAIYNNRFGGYDYIVLTETGKKMISSWEDILKIKSKW